MRVCYRLFEGFSTIQTQRLQKTLTAESVPERRAFHARYIKTYYPRSLASIIENSLLLVTTEDQFKSSTTSIPCKMDFVTPASVSKATVNVINLKIDLLPHKMTLPK